MSASPTSLNLANELTTVLPECKQKNIVSISFSEKMLCGLLEKYALLVLHKGLSRRYSGDRMLVYFFLAVFLDNFRAMVIVAKRMLGFLK